MYGDVEYLLQEVLESIYICIFFSLHDVSRSETCAICHNHKSHCFDEKIHVISEIVMYHENW